MFVLSRDSSYLRVAPRETRSARKVVFKVPAKILLVYERWPYNLRTKLWNGLDKETQKKDTIYAFKNDIDKLYRNYRPV